MSGRLPTRAAATAAGDEGIARADALLLDHRRLTVQASALLARASTRSERLALADELITLIERLDAAKGALADRIRRGRAASAAVSAYGRALATRR